MVDEMRNILIIYTDQLRRDVLGCYGGREVPTPNIDFIAENGIQMEECYTPSAVCTPSRGCFMTGRYPYRNGAYRNGIPVKPDEHGFAEAFAQSGYETIYIGKWHLADHKEMGENLAEPQEFFNMLGFENWQHKIEIGHCKSIQVLDGKLHPSKQMGNETSYTTDWLTTETIRCLNERDRKKPFLCMVSIPDPHQPYQVRKPYDTMFDPLDVELPESFYEKELPDWAEKDEWGRKHYLPRGMFEREGHLRRMKALYLGMVKCIDDNVGRLLGYLKAEGLWDETIVVFTSDHGEYMGEHGLMEKNNLYESVYHIPMLIAMPGYREKKNKGCFNVIDFGTTLAGLAGIGYPFVTDGSDRSYAIMEDLEDENVEVYIHPTDVPRAGIITDKYELAYIGRGWKGEVFHDHILFDRKKDPLQMNNLYGKPEYEAVVKELTEKIRQHHRRFATPVDALPEEVR